MKPHLELDPVEGCAVGKNPDAIGADGLIALGVLPQPLLRAIRAKCLDCCGEKSAEVRRCGMIDCPLWAYRMGSNPFRKPMSEEQKRAAGQRLQAHRGAVAS